MTMTMTDSLPVTICQFCERRIFCAQAALPGFLYNSCYYCLCTRVKTSLVNTRVFPSRSLGGRCNGDLCFYLNNFPSE